MEADRAIPSADSEQTEKRVGQGSGLPSQTSQPSRAASRSTSRRKLHVGHFAFMRSVVQGLDTRESWNRYLRVEGEHDDIGKVNRTIAWIRDEFAAAAKRSDRHGTARLVRIDVRDVADRAPALPTVEEFAADHGLEDFSAVEQFEQYKAHFAAAVGRPSRRSRLITRQLEALTWLERLVVQPPGPDDSIASWLHPDLGGRLEQAGVVTLRELVDRINGMGMRWWTGIRAIGSGKAARIVEWLTAHEESIGLSIGTHVASKRSTWSTQQRAGVLPPATGIVPINKLIVPAALDGTNGLYRSPRHVCAIGAENDVEAIFAWIETRGKHVLRSPTSPASDPTAAKKLAGSEVGEVLARKLSHTQRAYLKEAERFLLWAIVEQGKALSSLSRGDCAAYCEFLKNPSPAARWCGPRNREKWGPLWRPFEGALSPRAQRQAVTILKTLGKFLSNAGYLLANPWDGVRLPAPAPRMAASPKLRDGEWEAVMACLDRLPATSANERLKFALPLLQATGLRLAEATGATVDDLQRIGRGSGGEKDAESGSWILNIAHVDGGTRQLPLPNHMTVRLTSYLISRGLSGDLADPANCGAYLIGKAVDVADRAPWSPQPMLEVDAREGVVPGTLSRQIKRFFADFASALAPTDIHGARKFAGASTHLLRRLPARKP